MNWILVALSAPATYATVTFIDKYLLSRHIKDYNAMPIYTSIVAFIAGVIFWFINGFPVLPLQDTLIVLTTGILTGFSLIAYFKALSQEDTSNITILFQMFPIITLLLSLLFLKESINLFQLIGFLLVLSSGVIISLKKSKKRTHISSVFWLIFLYDLLWASAGVLMKFAINANSFAQVLNYESWGIAIGGAIIFILFGDVRSAFLKSLKKVKAKTLLIIGFNEGVFVIAKSLTFFAFSLGPAALVSVLETTQTFFAIIYGYLLTLLFPSIFNEDISRKGLNKKLLAAFIALTGIFLINL